ncbi:MAG: redox-sensing transcriptional repressor Rex [Spirochaetes bacterium]|nr:redox-sensing transcriptional repressor Rex [Spirochaetota bacterium]
MENKNCIIRLSHYKSALNRFKSLGFIKIFSDYLADAAGVSSAQVRKDFSLFGIAGNKRGGYQIDALLEQLNVILGKNQIQNVILVGAGHMGAALLRYKNFEKEGIRIVCAFDIDPAKCTTKQEIPVLPLSELEKYVAEQAVRIAIICVPAIAAQATLDMLVKAGVKGVLNFAPIQLKAPEDCSLSYVNVETELENLIYKVNARERSDMITREKAALQD